MFPSGGFLVGSRCFNYAVQNAARLAQQSTLRMQSVLILKDAFSGARPGISRRKLYDLIMGGQKRPARS